MITNLSTYNIFCENLKKNYTQTVIYIMTAL